MKKYSLLARISYWLYHCESCRVENCAFEGHYFFGSRKPIIGKFLYELWSK